MSKFFVPQSMTCIECGESLLGMKVAYNPKHVYPLGILYKCRCTSRCWANSLRNANAFLASLEGGQEYRSGFCNDPFCAYCFGYLQPLKNGYVYKGKRYDLYGCTSCKQNQKIAVDVAKNLREGGEKEYLTGWYKRHIDELRAGIAGLT